MKSVLIISNDAYELSVEHVMDWILALGGHVYRLNGDDFELNGRAFSIQNSLDVFKLVIGEEENLNREYQSVWFRRWKGNHHKYDLCEALSSREYSLSLSFDLI